MDRHGGSLNRNQHQVGFSHDSVEARNTKDIPSPPCDNAIRPNPQINLLCVIPKNQNPYQYRTLGPQQPPPQRKPTTSIPALPVPHGPTLASPWPTAPA